MSTVTLTQHDLQVRDNVVRQLDWDPAVDASAIGVSARDGVVTLTGAIDTYAGKLAAERVAKRVRGVRGVANDLEVRLKSGRTDSEIALDAVHALALRATVPHTVQATVHDGHVTLTGRVRSLFQALEAEKAVRHIRGVRGIFTHLDVSPDAVARDVKHKIVEALHRSADVDARRVSVAVEHGRVMLSGAVASWQQRETAERAAANAQGVTQVVNEITVQPDNGDEIC